MSDRPVPIALRTTRANFGTYTIATASTMLRRLNPSAATIAMDSRMDGNASTMSIARIRKPSSLPPKYADTSPSGTPASAASTTMDTPVPRVRCPP